MKTIGCFISTVAVAASMLFATDVQAQEKKLKIKAKGYSASELPLAPQATEYRQPVRVSSYSGHRTTYGKSTCQGKKKSIASTSHKHRTAYKGSLASKQHKHKKGTMAHSSSTSYRQNTMGSFAGYRTDAVKWKKIKMKKKDGEWEYKYKR